MAIIDIDETGKRRFKEGAVYICMCTDENPAYLLIINPTSGLVPTRAFNDWDLDNLKDIKSNISGLENLRFRSTDIVDMWAEDFFRKYGP